MNRLLALLLCAASVSVAAQERRLNGTVCDAQTGAPLPAATVWIEGTQAAVVTNGDGVFSIRVPEQTTALWVKQTGYETQMVALGDRDQVQVRLVELPRLIDGVVIRGGDPLQIVLHALRSAKSNRPQEATDPTAFYREVIRRRGRVVAVAEAVVDMYKAGATSLRADQARIYKGRRSTDYSRLDTAVVRYRGGVATALNLDFAKHWNGVFWDVDSIGHYYTLRLEGVTQLQGRDQLVVSFDERAGVTSEALYRGTMYIDATSYAFSRVEFWRNVEGRPEVGREFVVQLPAGYRIEVPLVRYAIDYLFDGAVWHYNYSIVELALKVSAPKRRFDAQYSVVGELVVTDRSERKVAVERFLPNERLRANDMVFDRVVDYADEAFWADFTVIEPEMSLERAVKQINKKIKIEQ